LGFDLWVPIAIGMKNPEGLSPEMYLLLVAITGVLRRLNLRGLKKTSKVF